MDNTRYFDEVWEALEAGLVVESVRMRREGRVWRRRLVAFNRDEDVIVLYPVDGKTGRAHRGTTLTMATFVQDYDWPGKPEKPVRPFGINTTMIAWMDECRQRLNALEAQVSRLTIEAEQALAPLSPSATE